MLRLILKYFILNLALNIIDIPISFFVGIAYLTILPPATSLGFEFLVIWIIFIPIVSAFVSFIGTNLLLRGDKELNINRKILILFVNILIPLSACFLVYVLPLIQTQQKAVSQRKSENAEIEAFKKDGLQVINCQEYYQATYNSSVIISDYERGSGIYVKCTLKSKRAIDLQIHSFVKQYDLNGNLKDYPEASELRMQGVPESGGFYVAAWPTEWTELSIKIPDPNKDVSYFVITLSFDDANLRLDYPDRGSLKGHFMDFTYTTKKYNFL